MKNYCLFFAIALIVVSCIMSCSEESSTEDAIYSPQNDFSRISVSGGVVEHSYEKISIQSYINILPELRPVCTFGIQYSKSESMSSCTSKTASSIESDNSYKTTIEMWPLGEPIYYRSFVKYLSTNVYEYGDVQKYVWDSVDIPESGAVDFGLSVKWGACLLGASSPIGYPDAFAFGETKSKTHFNKENYTFDYEYYFEKYFENAEVLEGSTTRMCTLERKDDAAYKYLGGKWRTPTVKEWIELGYDIHRYMTEDEAKFLSNYSGGKQLPAYHVNYKGVEGYLLTNNKQGIFIRKENHFQNYPWHFSTMYMNNKGTWNAFIRKGHLFDATNWCYYNAYEGGYILPVMDY